MMLNWHGDFKKLRFCLYFLYGMYKSRGYAFNKKIKSTLFNDIRDLTADMVDDRLFRVTTLINNKVENPKI